MTRVLAVGAGPRPHPARRRMFAPGLRLQAAIDVLREAGHEVHVAEFLMAGEAQRPGDDSTELPFDLQGATQAIASLDAGLRPDCVVALTDMGGAAAALSGTRAPLFVDYYGHPFAEKQMQAAVHGSNAALADQWRLLLPALLRADAFGTCNERQRWALTGELGAAGRLDAENAGTELVHNLGVALPFRDPFPGPAGPVARGRIVPADARIILFTGGYNTWLDEETLFAAAERVLAEDAKAHYVSTGGAITGHVSRVFENFERLAKASPHADRFHFVGWLAHEELLALCQEADAGVICDRWTLEGVLGARTRAFLWIWAGMRAVLADASEMTAQLGALGLAHVAKPGTESLVAALGEALDLGRPGPQEAEARRELLRAHFRPEYVFAPLLEWVAEPRHAPDWGRGNPLRDFQQDLVRAEEKLALGRELADRLAGSRAASLLLMRQPEIQRLVARLRDGGRD